MIDTPTNNFATLNPLSDLNRITSTSYIKEGNLRLTSPANGASNINAITYPSSGKWYAEYRVISYTEDGGGQNEIGIWNYSHSKEVAYVYTNQGHAGSIDMGAGSYVQSGMGSTSPEDIISVAWDVDARAVTFYKNGTQIGLPQTYATITEPLTFGIYIDGPAATRSGDGQFNFGQG